MKHILLVEDDKDESMTLKGILEDEGYRVDTAENGRFALDLMGQNVYDLVLTDLVMPVTDGIKFLHTLSGSDCDVPVVVVTGHEDIENMLSAFHLGAIDVLYKPYDIDELLGLVNKILSKDLN